MGNLLEICINRSEYRNKRFIGCSICDKKYTPDLVMPPVCHDCKMLDNDGYYEFEVTSSLLARKDYQEVPHEAQLAPPQRDRCRLL